MAEARKHWFGSPASAYVPLIPLLTNAARKVGYALGVHGSFGFDLDLVLIPWTEEAVSPDDLIATLRSALQLSDAFRTDGPQEKPHGRVAYTLPLGVGLALDVSIMPRESARPLEDRV